MAEGMKQIPLSKPDIGPREEEMVLDVVRSGRLSMGPMLARFEEVMATRLGRRRAVGVSSGTAGLHVVLSALGIGEGDEVITTPFSFVASANCIEYVGARPVFVDIEPASLNMCPKGLMKALTPETRAIVAVETFGNPAHMDAYASIAARHEIPLIEDACEALGAGLGARPAGSFGRAAVFGFYPNKQITTGEGGMIVTDDERLADLCVSLRNQGREVAGEARDASVARPGGQLGGWLQHARLGYNYRLSELHAALGVAQMSRLDDILERRHEVASLYVERLIDNSRLVLPTVVSGAEMSWFVFVVRLTSDYSVDDRDRVIAGLHNHDIGAAPYFPCIHLQPHYRKKYGYAEGDFPIAESVSQRTIALPFHSSLGEREIDLVVQTLDLMINRLDLSRG